MKLLGIQLREGSHTFDKVNGWNNRDEGLKTANLLFKRRFTCRRRPRFLRSLMMGQRGELRALAAISELYSLRKQPTFGNTTTGLPAK